MCGCGRVVGSIYTQNMPKSPASFLDGLGVPHRSVSHPPIYSVQDGIDLGLPELMGVPMEHLVKNLLLQDTHGRLVLIVALGDARLDLKGIAHKLGCSRLSFASPQTMTEVLGSEPGSASLFDLLNNPHAQEVTVFLDCGEVDGDIGFPEDGNTRTILFPAKFLPKVVDRLTNQTDRLSA